MTDHDQTIPNTAPSLLQNPARKHPIHTTSAAQTPEASILTEEVERLDASAAHSIIEEEDPYKAVRGEIALWRAVITQALTDALSQSNKAEMFYEKTQACAWLDGRVGDFFTVCDFAQMNPHYVRRRAAAALQKKRLPLSRKPLPTKTSTVSESV